MTMQVANNGVSCLTRFFTASSLEKRAGYLSRVTINTRHNPIPIMIEVNTATTSENLAALGWAAPSSFETLTLYLIITKINFFFYYYQLILQFIFVITISFVKFLSTDLIAAFTPKATITAHPNMFMLPCINRLNKLIKVKIQG